MHLEEVLCSNGYMEYLNRCVQMIHANVRGRRNETRVGSPSRSIPQVLWGGLQTQLRQPRMVIRATSQRPVELALGFLDRHVVDAGKAVGHQTVFSEFPVLIAIRAEPVARVVVPFVGITHGDAVVGEGPQLFDQAVIQLFLPFAGKKSLGLFAVGGELGAVTPFSVQGVGQRDFFRVALAYTLDTKWRNRAEFATNREEAKGVG